MSDSAPSNHINALTLAELTFVISIKAEIMDACKVHIDQVLREKLPPHLAEAAVQPSFEEHCAQMQAERLDKARADASEGNGPQPFDREWIENDCDFEQLVSRFDYHLTSDFLEVLNMALSSAEGQRALARRDDPLNPRQHVLSLIEELRNALTLQRIDLLSLQGQALGWDPEILQGLGGDIEDP